MSGGSGRLHFTGIPVFKTDLAPLTKLERKGKDVARVPVLYTITEIPGETKRILVHPDRWDQFIAAMKPPGAGVTYAPLECLDIPARYLSEGVTGPYHDGECTRYAIDGLPVTEHRYAEWLKNGV